MAIPNPYRSTARWSVAVYWPGDGYGTATTVMSWQKAIEKVEQLSRLGYGKPGRSEIHVRRTETDVWKFETNAETID